MGLNLQRWSQQVCFRWLLCAGYRSAQIRVVDRRTNRHATTGDMQKSTPAAVVKLCKASYCQLLLQLAAAPIHAHLTSGTSRMATHHISMQDGSQVAGGSRA